MNNLTIGIYIHIPFCVKKCNYCDFLSFAADDDAKALYIKALIAEIKGYASLYGKSGRVTSADVASVFFGGGTPSAIKSEAICDIMSVLYDCFNILPDAEITIECNPGTIDADKLNAYHKAGINRLSIGLQSADNAELSLLGRVHTYEDFCTGFECARATGFDNINIDIMSAIPGQTLASYKSTVNKVLSLKPEHISAYSLIIEEGTMFYDVYSNYKSDCGFPPLPDENSDRDMYYITDAMLKNNGLHRYEISNYSREGYECKHNLGYWSRMQYLGLGLGASSFIANVRFKNISDMKEYISICTDKDFERANEKNGNPKAYHYYDKLLDTSNVFVLTKKNEMAEYMYLGLRKTKGVSINGFYDAFGVRLEDVYGNVIKKHTKYRLLTTKGDFMALTEKGLDVSNTVLSDFII